jgi:hypothetical protein
MRALLCALVLSLSASGCSLFASHADDWAAIHSSAEAMRASWRGYAAATAPKDEAQAKDVEAWRVALDEAFAAMLLATEATDAD